ncbi:MAG: methyltransferase, partial [Candidatus Omnitrophica bacterium]|nr:methyltransferase [Candidatus Omnitrophota bacterium]
MSDEELFLTAVLQCNRTELYTRGCELTSEQSGIFEDMKRRRKNHEPVQYITGFTEFMGHRINVGPGVLIPRPETEVLCDILIQALKAQNKREYFILDIGTGSGCIPIAILKAIPQARVMALDVTEEPLSFAK